VLRGGDSPEGTAAEEALALAERAAPGQVLVGDVVELLGQAAHRFVRRPGLSPPEIAERLSRTEASINGLHHRGRRTMIDALEDLDAGPAVAAA
jgi:hypothetical protein